MGFCALVRYAAVFTFDAVNRNHRKCVYLLRGSRFGSTRKGKKHRSEVQTVRSRTIHSLGPKIARLSLADRIDFKSHGDRNEDILSGGLSLSPLKYGHFRIQESVSFNSFLLESDSIACESRDTLAQLRIGFLRGEISGVTNFARVCFFERVNGCEAVKISTPDPGTTDGGGGTLLRRRYSYESAMGLTRM